MDPDANPLPPMLRAIQPSLPGVNLPPVPKQVIAWQRAHVLADVEHLGSLFPALLGDLMSEAAQRLQRAFDRDPLGEKSG